MMRIIINDSQSCHCMALPVQNAALKKQIRHLNYDYTVRQAFLKASMCVHVGISVTAIKHVSSADADDTQIVLIKHVQFRAFNMLRQKQDRRLFEVAIAKKEAHRPPFLFQHRRYI